MGKARRKFDEQYKREAVRFLEETGRPLREVAAELKVSEQNLWRWRQQYGTGDGEQLTPSERAELRRLRREIELLRQERDFLKKAAAYFAKPSP
jgi:transposase